jgi:hypothetical protein
VDTKLRDSNELLWAAPRRPPNPINFKDDDLFITITKGLIGGLTGYEENSYSFIDREYI